MKRRSVLERILKKVTEHLSDAELTELLNDLDGEVDDEKAEKIIAALMTADEAAGNDAVFSKIKGRAKAEALDGVDKILKNYEGKLTPEAKAEYAKLGADSYKKYNFLLKHFDELGTKKGDANYEDLKAEFDALKSKIETDYVAKSEYETVKGQVTARQQDATNTRLLIAAIKSGKLKDVSGDRHFERNFLADAQEVLEGGLKDGSKTIKVVIDHETGKLMRADSPEQPALIGGRAATLVDLAEQTITRFDWAKKSNTSSSEEIQIPKGDAQAKGSNAALRAMLEMEAKEDK
ncbi:hypothetical protein GCM10023189_43090 [Nibrella saemangeumensis]|uniref:Uncharacterized protein n=1 Tax=Nibrella saemangeumensis TaxID=1084526 RepID=A0ABP8NEB6_9BACT